MLLVLFAFRGETLFLGAFLMTTRFLLQLSLLSCVLGHTLHSTAATLEPLDFRPYAISADGSVVVGQISSSREAARWTREQGTVGLGFLQPGEGAKSWATNVSGDGSVIVGREYVPDTGTYFLWTPEAGMVSSPIAVKAVSADGSVLFGRSNRQAARWTAGEGIVVLGSLPGHETSWAHGVSPDGSVVVGWATEPFRWTAEQGMVSLGSSHGTAYDVSADGSVVVGESPGAFRWTAEQGMTKLGWLGPYDPPWQVGGSVATAVSGDGSVVVGYDWVFSGPDREKVAAWIWDEPHGMRAIEDLLTDDYGLDLTGWGLTAATDISADGRVIVGYGYAPDGVSQGWIAVIPEPSTPLLLLLAALPLAVRAWRRRVYAM